MVDHDLLGPVQVHRSEPGRQVTGENPVASVQIDELAAWNAVVNFQVRKVIVFNIIITRRSPVRL